MDDSDRSSYDILPYESLSFPRSHPHNLATVATLFGLTPAPVEECRVLELGCAGGGNIIPMAFNLPESSFVGLDLSPRQIEMGQKNVAALRLANIELRDQSISDIGPDLGTFDYIIVHGVYSWVAEDVRDKILSVCDSNLAANGVAYVSYNTYPGWHMPEALREMMLYHIASFEGPERQTGQARALLNFLHQATADKSNAYSQFLKDEVEVLAKKRDSYIFHEFLEAVNNPVYFHEFVEDAERHGLQYLGEANVAAMSIEHFPKKIAEKLRLAKDVIRREQYMDFLLNRRFRATLLCHQAHNLVRHLDPDRLLDLQVSSAARLDPEGPDPLASEKVRVVTPRGSGATISWPPRVKAALTNLWRDWPRATPFLQLCDEVREALRSTEETAAERKVLDQQLAADLLKLYQAGILDVHRYAPSLASAISERPKATSLVRLQARENPWVTNQWHTPVALNPFDRRLVQILDGANDRAALEAEMARLVEAGKLVDKGAKDIDGAAQKAKDSVDGGLQRALRNALLVG